MLVHRQLGLATGEEFQSRMEPVRLDARQQLDALVGERLGGVPPRVVLAAVAARRYNRPDPLIEGGGQQDLLPLREWPASPIRAMSTSGTVAR